MFVIELEPYACPKQQREFFSNAYSSTLIPQTKGISAAAYTDSRAFLMKATSFSGTLSAWVCLNARSYIDSPGGEAVDGFGYVVWAQTSGDDQV